MKIYFVNLVFGILLISCRSTTPNNCLPDIVLEAYSDTVKSGDYYKAKICLSDTNFLYKITKDGEYKVRPKIMINKIPLEVDNNGVAEFEFEAKKTGDYLVSKQSFYCEIMFPIEKKDVIIGRHIVYWVIEND